MQALLQVAYDNGHIYKDTYEGLYCVACEAYYTEDELVDGLCPIHHRPVERLSEENWFFKLSAFEQPLLDWYEAHPGFVQPEGKRNEALGLIKQGLRDISISRTSIRWGVEVPWDPEHVFYVWYDALINYATAVGYGSRPRAVRAVVARGAPRHRQGHPPLPLRVLAGAAPGGGHRPAEADQRPRLPAGRRREDEQDQPEPDLPADLVEDFGVDGYRYHFLGATPFGPDGDFSYEGMVERYNSDLANNLGNLQARVATVVGKKCDGIGPGAAPGQPAGGGGRPGLRRRGRGLGAGAAVDRARRDVAAHP